MISPVFLSGHLKNTHFKLITPCGFFNYTQNYDRELFYTDTYIYIENIITVSVVNSHEQLEYFKLSNHRGKQSNSKTVSQSKGSL